MHDRTRTARLSCCASVVWTSRWIPLAGAAAVSAYAYWDTLQVAKTAQRLLAAPKLESDAPKT